MIQLRVATRLRLRDPRVLRLRRHPARHAGRVHARRIRRSRFLRRQPRRRVQRSDARRPQGGSGQNCSSTGCVVDLNGSCPSELRGVSVIFKLSNGVIRRGSRKPRDDLRGRDHRHQTVRVGLWNELQRWIHLRRFGYGRRSFVWELRMRMRFPGTIALVLRILATVTVTTVVEFVKEGFAGTGLQFGLRLLRSEPKLETYYTTWDVDNSNRRKYDVDAGRYIDDIRRSSGSEQSITVVVSSFVIWNHSDTRAGLLSDVVAL
ncbi:hypothetical protein Bca52824_084534 [Brassica carinata]|uniref:Uncharacterized protein n=1 Tax=Brassica carinata TaxID=52824 RepID=A0A8X7PNX2_BRACI|nr:hypothetical protein Bca52824_084534 [Brassica carinata]